MTTRLELEAVATLCFAPPCAQAGLFFRPPSVGADVQSTALREGDWMTEAAGPTTGTTGTTMETADATLGGEGAGCGFCISCRSVTLKIICFRTYPKNKGILLSIIIVINI